MALPIDLSDGRPRCPLLELWKQLNHEDHKVHEVKFLTLSSNR